MKVSDKENEREMENRKNLIKAFLAHDGYTIGTTRGNSREAVEDVLKAFLDYADTTGQRLAPMYRNGREVTAIARGVDLTLGSGDDAVTIHVETQRTVKADLVLVRDMIEAIEYSDGIVTIPAKYFDEGAGR